MAAYVVTGFKVDTYNITSKELWASNSYGTKTDELAKSMHGYTYVEGKPEYGYTYVFFYMMPFKRWVNARLDNPQATAVTGGFVYASNDTGTRPWVKENMWGTIDKEAVEVALFYSGDKVMTYRVMAAFDSNNAAPIVSLWGNDAVTWGPNRDQERVILATNLGSYGENGRFEISLAKVVRVDLLGVSFPNLGDAIQEQIPMVIESRSLENFSTVEQMQTFSFDGTYTDNWKHTFKGGFKISAKTKVQTKLPFLVKGELEVGMETNFEWGDENGHSETFRYSNTIPVRVPPHSRMICTAMFSKGRVTTAGIYSLRYTFENGGQQEFELPVEVTTEHAFGGTVSYKEEPLEKDGEVEGTVALHVAKIPLPSKCSHVK